jgi:hypothetical protein
MPSATYDEALDRAAETWEFSRITGTSGAGITSRSRKPSGQSWHRWAFARIPEELDQALEQRFRDEWSRVLPRVW